MRRLDRGIGNRMGGKRRARGSIGVEKTFLVTASHRDRVLLHLPTGERSQWTATFSSDISGPPSEND
jgi:hypothetical protein